MKAIITKYAVTTGIKVVHGTLSADRPMLSVGQAPSFVQYYHGSDFHTSSATAKLDVLERFKRKRRSLENQLARLDNGLARALQQIDESEIP